MNGTKLYHSPELGECLITSKAPDRVGYRRVNGKLVSTYRIVWEQEYGTIPEGMQVCHKCDRCGCAEKTHLFLGTHTDNMRDMFAKGRRRIVKGYDHYKAKLTSEQEEAIRADKRIIDVIATSYNVSSSTIKRIRANRRFA